MASKTSNETDGWPGRRVDMSDFARRLAARKAELGLSDDSAHPELCRRARNADNDRTPSKRALLKAIEELGGKW